MKHHASDAAGIPIRRKGRSARLRGSAAPRPPLYVDLDGTLLATDSLLESALHRIKRQPLDIFRIPGWLFAGRAHLKAELANDPTLEVSAWPYREPLLRRLQDEREQGRSLYLATGADRRIAEKVAAHLKLFDGLLASDGQTNLVGAAKLRAIREHAGNDGFAYAGDSARDLPIWEAAESGIQVNPPKAVGKALPPAHTVEYVHLDAPIRMGEWMHGMRVHQWLKNLLVFVALLTSFRMRDPSAVMEAVMAFLAFSFCASSIYVINDLLDLEADRAHARKRHRPFASGRIPIATGLGLSAVCMAAGLGIAWIESPALLAVIACYLAITTVYSMHLKTLMLMDVVVLAVLYALRIFGGAIAIQVTISVWLLGFALFIFLSLAVAKRCSELVSLQRQRKESPARRNYRVGDLSVLWPLGVSTGICSVLVFALFISTADLPHYSAPALLWLVALTLFYWLCRVWIKTARGELFDDPLVFAVKDPGSRVAIAIMVALTMAAHLLELPENRFLEVR